MAAVARRDFICGPWMWRRSDGTVPRAGYFSAASFGKAGFRVDRIDCADADEREQILSAMVDRASCNVLALWNSVPIGELQIMHVCNQTWPGELTRLREERAASRTAA
jgi:hypothetical protein